MRYTVLVLAVVLLSACSSPTAPPPATIPPSANTATLTLVVSSVAPCCGILPSAITVQLVSGPKTIIETRQVAYPGGTVKITVTVPQTLSVQASSSAGGASREVTVTGDQQLTLAIGLLH